MLRDDADELHHTAIFVREDVAVQHERLAL
jgi:hypothetical protein